jgi:hypothetical protein
MTYRSTAFPSTKHTTHGKTFTPSRVVKKGVFSTFALRNKVWRCLSARIYRERFVSSGKVMARIPYRLTLRCLSMIAQRVKSGLKKCITQYRCFLDSEIAKRHNEQSVTSCWPQLTGCEHDSRTCPDQLLLIGDFG